jgi:hypothetical protein
MKTSKAYFKRFKKAFLYWQEKLGLTQYCVRFFHEKLGDNYAELKVGEQEKAACVYLTTELSGRDVTSDEGPEDHAKHEAIHLLLHRIGWLGEQRWTASDEIHDEAEAVVVRLEKVLK